MENYQWEYRYNDYNEPTLDEINADLTVMLLVVVPRLFTCATCFMQKM